VSKINDDDDDDDDECRLDQRQYQSRAPATNAFCFIYGSQNAPRVSVFHLPPAFPMTQNVSSRLGLDVPVDQTYHGY